MNFAALSFMIALCIFGVFSKVSEKCDDCMPDNSYKSPVCAKGSHGDYVTFKNKEIYECEKACGGDIEYVKEGYCEGNYPYFYNICGGGCRLPDAPDAASRSYCFRSSNGQLDHFVNARTAYCNKLCQPTIKLLHPGRCQEQEP